MKTRVRLLLVGVALSGLAMVCRGGAISPLLAQAQAPSAVLPTEVTRFREWSDAAWRHIPASEDAPLDAVAKWPAADLKSTLATLLDLRKALAHGYPKAGGIDARHLMRGPGGGKPFPAILVQDMFGQTDEEARRGDANRLLKRGALLHTDAAILVSFGVLLVPDVPGERSPVWVADGTRRGPDRSLREWQMAAGLLDAITPDASRDETVHLWYLATAAFMRENMLHGSAEPLLRRARELFPHDADIQFTSACWNEAMAAPNVQASLAGVTGSLVVKTSTGASITQPTKIDVAAMARTYWSAAIVFFHEALRLRADWPEAHLRLGRVLGLLGRHRDAIEELQRALDTTNEPSLVYYGSLYLGAEEEATGHHDAARTCYERALTYRPRAQAPHLALSLLARSAGDRNSAQSEVRTLFQLPAGQNERYDPLWDYFGPRSTRPIALFEQFRAAVTARGGR